MLDPQLIDKLQKKIREILPELVSLRRQIHSEPETGLDTFNTSKKIKAVLSNTSMNFKAPLLGSDLIGEIGEGNTIICFRADMDAISHEESSDLPYKSLVPGVMHACGHDGHAAILTGAALVINEFRDYLPAKVRFIFQPGEELICAGKTMIEKGACDGCEAAFALHGWPGLPAGSISTLEGPFFAAGGTFEIAVHGQSCHGATPDKGINPIPEAAKIAMGMQYLNDTALRPNNSLATVCVFESGYLENIIPDTAVIKGTVRFLDQGLGDIIETAIRKLIDCAISEQNGIKADLKFDISYDLPVVNTKKGYLAVKSAAENHAAWIEESSPTMAMEDFAYYLNGREGAMFQLGLGEDYPALHSSIFDFNDDVIEAGVMMFCTLALDYRA